MKQQDDSQQGDRKDCIFQMSATFKLNIQARTLNCMVK